MLCRESLSFLRQASPKSRESKKSMKDVEFSPSCCREDVASVRSCAEALLHLTQGRTAAGSKPSSCTEIALARMQLEHAPKHSVVECVVAENG